MRKVIFGLIATVFMVNLSWGQKEQKISKEDARKYATEVFISFKNSLKDNYSKSKDYNSFLISIYGSTKPTTVPEGQNMLKTAYNHLSIKTTDDELKRTFDGKVVASAFKFMQVNKDQDGSKLFNINETATVKSLFTKSMESNYGCRWWQVGCWLKEIFGDEAGQAIINAIVQAIIALL